MGFDLGVIEGKYLRDLLDQPRALEDTLETMESSQQLSDLASRLNHGRFHRIVLTGMGSSFHALHPLNLQLIRHGFTVVMVETSELIHYQGHLFDPNTLMVAVSQSGQSAEMVRLTAVNRKRSTVIAVTNTARSPLAERAAVTLFTQAGQESSVSCKTYVTALMTLKWLGDILCERNERQSRRELRNASPAVATYLSSWQRHVTSMTEMLSGIRHLFLVGRGASLAAVGTGALIIKESDHFPAEGMSSAAFRHGPFEMLNEEILVVVFSGDDKTCDLNHRLLADIRQARGRAELVSETALLKCLRLPNHGESIRAIVEVLPVQMVTLALAALAGREPGKFDLASKVTTTE